MTDAIALSHVTHRFGEHVAVDDLSLEVAPGECFGLLGPNGAGKTTTIRLLKTLVPVRRGTSRSSGSMSRQAMPVRRCWVMSRSSFRSKARSPGGRTSPGSRGCSMSLVASAQRGSTRCSTSSVSPMPPIGMAGTYSGGMVRRLELAQALVNRPSLLVLDEPTVGLDPVARDSVWDRVDRCSGHGMTVLLTTHYMDEAERCVTGSR